MYEIISHSLLNILCIHEQIYLSFYTECLWLLSWSHLYRKSWMYLEKQCGTHTHRIRAQKDTVLPDGIPDHIHNFPEQYDLEDCG